LRKQWSRTAAFVVALLSVVGFGGLAQPAAAAHTAQPATFSAAFLPHAVVRGGTVIEAFSLTNTSSPSSGNRLGSADVSIPSGFRVASARFDWSPFRDRDEGRPGEKDWNVSISGGVIHLRAESAGGGRNPQNDTLKPGQTVTFLFWMVVPCLAGDSSSWPATADGFTSSGVPTLNSVGSCAFVFRVRNPQHAGKPIQSTVWTVDGHGLPTSAFDGAATVSGTLGSVGDPVDPVYDTLSFHNGIAFGQPLATPYAAETGRTLTVSSGGISGTSNTFNVLADTASATLEFEQQPSDTTVDETISPAVVVDAVDQYGNVLPNSGSVTLAIGNDGAGGGSTLGGTTTQPMSGNAATFGDLTLDQAGDGFTLTATESGYASATSATFDVTGGSCPAGDTCQSDGAGTSVIGPEGSDITFGPVGQSFSCDDQELTSIGSIADISPPSDSEGTLTYNLFYSASVLPRNSDNHVEAPSELCISKDGGETYFSLRACGSVIDDSNLVVEPPCISDEGFTYNQQIETALIVTGYYYVIEIPADDPHVGGG